MLTAVYIPGALDNNTWAILDGQNMVAQVTMPPSCNTQAKVLAAYPEIANQLANPPAELAKRVITYKADIWRRATDDQADTIDTALNALGTRQRRLWDDAQYLDHSDALVDMLRAQMTAAFGKTEADRILAPSE